MHHNHGSIAERYQKVVGRSDRFGYDSIALSELHGRRLNHFEIVTVALVDADNYDAFYGWDLAVSEIHHEKIVLKTQNKLVKDPTNFHLFSPL